MFAKYLRLAPLVVLILGGASRLHSQGTAVLTWHNDNFRSGQNLQEPNLTLANVNEESFGKVGFFSTDGKVDAQPLYVPNIKILGVYHDVLYVASEHDSVYALGANTGNIYWHVSLLKSGETTATNGCSQLTPEIGVTSTPVIDLSQGPHGAIYVVSMSVDSSGNYHQRLNALDLTTGAQLFGGPTAIQASYPGTGDNSSGGKVIFDPKQYAERAALLEWNGDIYTSWTSHCDARPYTGWVIAYNASTLKQSGVLNMTPNGSRGAVWMSGAGPVGTSTGVLFMDANGTFDTTLNSNGFPSMGDFGNAFIKFTKNSSGLQITDFYATDTTVQQSSGDIDLGSGGALVLPPIYDNAGNEHYLAVGAGKDTNIYLVNRFDMGKYHSNGGYIYQSLSGALPKGEWSSPAYFANKVYFGGNSDYLRAFGFSNALLASTPVGISSVKFSYPGTTPSISANGSQNGIVWAVDNSSPNGILYAFNAQDLSEELYNSNQSGTRDQFGMAAHFSTPTITNGHVYIGAATGVAVFGLLKE